VRSAIRFLSLASAHPVGQRATARAACFAKIVVRYCAGFQGARASASLTAIDATRFTIIDFRALEALGIGRQPQITIDFYLAYLAECRRIASESNVTLRTLDRALAGSKERAQSVGLP
jgi:hypothetical protein